METNRENISIGIQCGLGKETCCICERYVKYKILMGKQSQFDRNSVNRKLHLLWATGELCVVMETNLLSVKASVRLPLWLML